MQILQEINPENDFIVTITPYLSVTLTFVLIVFFALACLWLCNKIKKDV